jgi:hypothetical protein
VACTGLGYFFNMYRGQPLVREGGVVIMSHPTTSEFHPVHHPSYIDFFEQVLADTNAGKVIVVGGEARAVRRLGFSPASTLQDALEMAEDVVGRDPSITHVHNPPLVMADVR